MDNFQGIGGSHKRIAYTEIDDVNVSTVCLPMMHIGGMYETMIFGGAFDEYQWRYETEQEALEHHEKLVEMINWWNSLIFKGE